VSFVSPHRLRVPLYAALVVYGSLFPFTGWRAPDADLLDFLAHLPDLHVHRADALTNVLAYMPLGLLIVRDLRGRAMRAVVAATLAGAALSFTMEFLQQFLPERVASLEDLATNTIGCLAGALLGALTRLDLPAMATLARLRSRRLGRGHGEEFGLLAVGLWALSQWVPFVPSLDLGELRAHLAPLWHTLLAPERFDTVRFAIYALDVGGLAYLVRTLAHDARLVLAFAALAIVVVFGKVVFAGRVLSLEAATGTLAALLVALPAFAMRPTRCGEIAIGLLVGGLAAAELHTDGRGDFYPFTWIPFSSQLESPLTGIASLLETLWPAVALSYLARIATPSARRAAVAWLGGVGLMLLVFTLEWNQQFLPGRVGDITPVLLIVATWAFCWMAMGSARSGVSVSARSPSQSLSMHRQQGDRP
jgi:VanZ family protein